MPEMVAFFSLKHRKRAHRFNNRNGRSREKDVQACQERTGGMTHDDVSWVFTAYFNPFEHRWIFISIRKQFQNCLPARIRLSMSAFVQKILGQFNNAQSIFQFSAQGLR
jgi:hypothetical protein